ncbi:MAG: acyltransferase family protein, partial [Actinobacteria bacterium]|nr:acyltransferase family protein [Actinomycetota bacterium]
MVVGYHAGISRLPGGYVGVDVFFVLSGFLMTALLVDELERTGRIDLRRFFARRIRRLLPLAILVLFATLLVGSQILAPVGLPDLVRDIKWAILYVANWNFAAQTTTYSDTAVTDSLTIHYWSLSIEEQFYFIWPILLVGVGALARTLSARGVHCCCPRCGRGILHRARCSDVKPGQQRIFLHPHSFVGDGNRCIARHLSAAAPDVAARAGNVSQFSSPRRHRLQRRIVRRPDSLSRRSGGGADPVHCRPDCRSPAQHLNHQHDPVCPPTRQDRTLVIRLVPLALAG